MIEESKNIVVKHLVNRLRDIKTDSFSFRTTIEELARALVTQAFSKSETIDKTVGTWQGDLQVDVIDEQNLVFIPILRAGEPMLTGVLRILPNVRSGFLAMKRDEETAKSHIFYENVPNLEGKTVVLLDPMLATGGSLVDAISLIKEHKPKKIISLNILGSQYGVDIVNKEHPDVDIIIAQVDSKLDENSYIVPGLGDAGDRAFHTV